MKWLCQVIVESTYRGLEYRELNILIKTDYIPEFWNNTKLQGHCPACSSPNAWPVLYA